MIFENLHTAGIEYIQSASVEYLVKGEAVVSAIMENLQNCRIEHLLFDDEFHFLVQIKIESHLSNGIDIKQKHILSIIKLYNFHEPSLPQPPLNIHRQYLTTQKLPAAPIKALITINNFHFLKCLLRRLNNEATQIRFLFEFAGAGLLDNLFFGLPIIDESYHWHVVETKALIGELDAHGTNRIIIA